MHMHKRTHTYIHVHSQTFLHRIGCTTAAAAPPGVRGDGGVCVGHAAARKHARAHARQGLDDVQVQPDALRLRAHDAPGPHRPVQGLKEWLRVCTYVRVCMFMHVCGCAFTLRSSVYACVRHIVCVCVVFA